MDQGFVDNFVFKQNIGNGEYLATKFYDGKNIR